MPPPRRLLGLQGGLSGLQRGALPTCPVAAAVVPVSCRPRCHGSPWPECSTSPACVPPMASASGRAGGGSGWANALGFLFSFFNFPFLICFLFPLSFAGGRQGAGSRRCVAPGQGLPEGCGGLAMGLPLVGASLWTQAGRGVGGWGMCLRWLQIGEQMPRSGALGSVGRGAAGRAPARPLPAEGEGSDKL